MNNNNRKKRMKTLPPQRKNARDNLTSSSNDYFLDLKELEALEALEQIYGNGNFAYTDYYQDNDTTWTLKDSNPQEKEEQSYFEQRKKNDTANSTSSSAWKGGRTAVATNKTNNFRNFLSQPKTTSYPMIATQHTNTAIIIHNPTPSYPPPTQTTNTPTSPTQAATSPSSINILQILEHFSDKVPDYMPPPPPTNNDYNQQSHSELHTNNSERVEGDREESETNGTNYDHKTNKNNLKNIKAMNDGNDDNNMLRPEEKPTNENTQWGWKNPLSPRKNYLNVNTHKNQRMTTPPISSEELQSTLEKQREENDDDDGGNEEEDEGTKTSNSTSNNSNNNNNNTTTSTLTNNNNNNESNQCFILLEDSPITNNPKSAKYPTKISINTLITPYVFDNSLISYPRLNKPIKDYIDRISDPKLQEIIFKRAFPSCNYVNNEVKNTQVSEKLKREQMYQEWLKEEENNDETGLITLSFDNRIIVKAGTVEKLLERLTYEKFPDPDYVSTFLLTYRSFTSASAVLSTLINRFDVPNPQNHNEDEGYIQYFHVHKRKPIQIRTCNTFKQWVEKHWYDFENDPNLTDTLMQFINEKVSAMYANIANNLKKIISNLKLGKQKEIYKVISCQIPKPIVPKSTKFSDFDVVEFARQFTLLEFEDYQAIQPTECIGQAWGKKKHKSPNICAMIARSNVVPLWVAHQILVATDGKARSRANCIATFIDIANELFKMNNFNGVMEILAGLQLTPVFRLRKSWELVNSNKRSLDTWNYLQSVMSSTTNWKNYRENIKHCDPPCIPYLGIFLTDLTFIEEGNTDTVECNNESLVHFFKCRLLAVVIQAIQLYQQKSYIFEKEATIQAYISNLECPLTEDELYTVSLEQEPRDPAA